MASVSRFGICLTHYTLYFSHFFYYLLAVSLWLVCEVDDSSASFVRRLRKCWM